MCAGALINSLTSLTNLVSLLVVSFQFSQTHYYDDFAVPLLAFLFFRKRGKTRKRQSRSFQEPPSDALPPPAKVVDPLIGKVERKRTKIGAVQK